MSKPLLLAPLTTRAAIAISITGSTYILIVMCLLYITFKVLIFTYFRCRSGHLDSSTKQAGQDDYENVVYLQTLFLTIFYWKFKKKFIGIIFLNQHIIFHIRFKD